MVFKFTTLDLTQDIDTTFPHSLPSSPDSTTCFSLGQSRTGLAAGRVEPGVSRNLASQANKKECREEADPCRLSEQRFPDQKQLRRFTFGELKMATENFDEKNVTGKGGFGTVYRGRLSTGWLVAVKRLRQETALGLEEFRTEMEVGKMVMHRNVVPLIGFCEATKPSEWLLLYLFVGDGTLFSHLHNRPESQPALSWSIRKRIALGVARGLSYLHGDCSLRIIHRDVKPANIMLDGNLEPRIGDFGLTRLMDHKQDMAGIIGREVESNNILMDEHKNEAVGGLSLYEPATSDEIDHVSTMVKGTPGYLDPEYLRTLQLTERSDVYSFGVSCLELITARRPVAQEKHIAVAVRAAIDRSKELYGLQAILDPALIISSSPQLRGLERFVDLSMRCVAESRYDRPTMREVVKEIENLPA